MVDHIGIDRVLRHGGVQRVVRTLGDGGAAAGPDRRGTQYAVVQNARHQHADRARAIRHCHRPEKRVDRRAVPVLRRPLGKRYVAVIDEEVMIRHRDVDVPGLKPGAVGRRHRGQGPAAVDDPGQHAWGTGRKMQDDQNRIRRVLVQA